MSNAENNSLWDLLKGSLAHENTNKISEQVLSLNISRTVFVEAHNIKAFAFKAN
jgi:hypothetical protein